MRIRDARTLLVGVLALVVGGCNIVTSAKPQFKDADLIGAPRLKPGVWSYTATCPAGPTLACGRPTPLFVVGPSSIDIAPLPNGATPLPHVQATYQIVNGDPLILQLRAEVSESGHETEARFLYVALAPGPSDTESLVASAEAWAVMCGPAPRPGEWNYGMVDHEGDITNHPYPGLVMDRETCHARRPDDIRHAAAATRKVFPAVVLRWISDRPLGP